LPASKEWHLYSEYESSPTIPIPPPAPKSFYFGKPIPPCSSIPVWARTRGTSAML
jgi:hypothetical protein